MPARKKDPSTRRRRNTTSTRAQLGAATPAGRPRLPQYAPGGERWHRAAIAWWRRLWHSPMAGQLLDADVSALLRLVTLEHDYWSATSSADRLRVSAEIRRVQAPFGLTPYDRRRLEWSVTAAPPPRALDTAPSAARSSTPAPAARPDPRAGLHAVQ